MRDDQDRLEEQRLRDQQFEQQRLERERKAEQERLERERESERQQREAELEEEEQQREANKGNGGEKSRGRLATMFFGSGKTDDQDGEKPGSSMWAKRERDHAPAPHLAKAADTADLTKEAHTTEPAVEAAAELGAEVPADSTSMATEAKPQFSNDDVVVKRPIDRKLVLLISLALLSAAGAYYYFGVKGGKVFPSAEPALSSRSLPTVAESDTPTSAAEGVALPPLAQATPETASVPAAPVVPTTPAATGSALPNPVSSAIDPAAEVAAPAIPAGKSANDVALPALTNTPTAPTSPTDVALAPVQPGSTAGNPAEAAAAAALGGAVAGSVNAAAFDALVQRVTKNEALSQSNEARITEMEKQVKELRELLTAKKPAASTASAAPVRRAQPRRPAQPRPAAVAAAPAPAPKYNGQILSVDMWGGKPSVVISTGDPNDKRVRILSPGESLNGITLKDANVQSRTATFEVGNGRTVQMGVEH